MDIYIYSVIAAVVYIGISCYSCYDFVKYKVYNVV